MLKISHFIFLLANPSIYVSANRESIYTLTEEATNLLLDYTYGTDNSTTVDEEWRNVYTDFTALVTC